MTPSTAIRLKRIGKTSGIAAAVLTVCITLGGALWSAAADRATTKAAVERNRAAMADHESRLRALERELQGIAADVRWIRRAIEQRDARGLARLHQEPPTTEH
ncbi:MAG TPA: hypothetical protein VFJ30_09565 [Phycisphaerae bacterium]|nr:hypothetical protein [Phycisphaerae bacterium]